MAVETVLKKRGKLGNLRANVVDISLLAETYKTGGIDIPFSKLGMGNAYVVIPSPAAGYMFEYDVQNRKMKAYTPSVARNAHQHETSLQASKISQLHVYTVEMVAGEYEPVYAQGGAAEAPIGEDNIMTLVAIDENGDLPEVPCSPPDVPRNICAILKGAAGGSTVPVGNKIMVLDLGGADGGTFTLSDGTDTTSAIAYDATAQAIQTAINAELGYSVEAETDLVWVNDLGDGTFSIHFDGTLGSVLQDDGSLVPPNMTLDASLLDNATNPALTVEREYNPIIFHITGKEPGGAVVEEYIPIAFNGPISEETTTLGGGMFVYNVGEKPFMEIDALSISTIDSTQEGLLVGLGIGANIGLPNLLNEDVEEPLEHVLLNGNPMPKPIFQDIAEPGMIKLGGMMEEGINSISIFYHPASVMDDATVTVEGSGAQDPSAASEVTNGAAITATIRSLVVGE